MYVRMFNILSYNLLYSYLHNCVQLLEIYAAGRH